MGKYVYYDGKVFTGIEGEAIAQLFGGKKFDDFKDLIEVGDLIKYGNNNYFSEGVIVRLVDDYCIEELEPSGYIKNKWILEIYKHIGKDFIRVCHREKEKWVID